MGIKSFRILCCDGGGVRGVLSARILQEVEKQILETKGLALHEYLDLVAATSTGSIITTAIASQLDSAQIMLSTLVMTKHRRSKSQLGLLLILINQKCNATTRSVGSCPA